MLEAYEPPPIDPAIQAELEEFVTRRRRELGD
jgi:trimethylamine:corrinoid methyltransferase-like protein